MFPRKRMSDNVGVPTRSNAGDAVFAGLSLELSSTVDRVVGELRRALFAGELDPGVPLREIALSEALGVSRSTIREALGVLVGEGLATREPHRGVRVTDLDPEAIRDVSKARRVLESAGVASWATATEADRDGVRRALAAFDEVAQDSHSVADMTAAHLGIHRALVALTGSRRLLGATDALNAEIRLVLARVDRVRQNGEQQVHSHAHLVELLESAAVEEVQAELQRHLDDAEESMLAAEHGIIDP